MSDIYQEYEYFKKFEIVYRKDDNELCKIRGKVHSIDSDSITVISSIEKHKAIELPAGMAVKVYVYTDNGIYYADSKILSNVKDEKYILYKISYPINNKHSQRREYFRANLNIPLKITLVRSLLNGNLKTFETTSKDICGNGVSFVIEDELKDYEDIIVAMEFPEKTIETSAKIVYTKTREVRGMTYHTFAMKFTNIDTKDTDFIVKKCFLHQLKLKNME